MQKENIIQGGIKEPSALEIWKELPEPDFPQCLLEVLDLKEVHEDLLQKAEKLRVRLQQRKEEEEKKRLDKEQEDYKKKEEAQQ